MNHKASRLFAVILLPVLFAQTSFAEVNLVDRDGWKVGLGGFIEFDSFYDTTRSYVETVGSAAVARKGTLNGDNGRTQFSLRNTRFAFNVQAPEVEGWKTRGYLETDFLGYDPAPDAKNVGSVSEAGFFSNPTLRIRHAFISAENANHLTVLVGQTWSMFGWQPNYVLSSISVNPITGTLYVRTARIGAIQKFTFNDSNELQAGIALERPTQRDGKIPNVVAGVRWSDPAYKGGITGPNTDIKAQPMSAALSGTYRNYDKMTSPTTSTSDQTSVPAFAFAADVLIPIIPSADGKDVAHSLTLTGEFTSGRGYGDQMVNWSGGLKQTYTSDPAGSNSSNDNLDAGIGGYNGANSFDLVNLRTWNTQLQYFLQTETFATIGFGQLYSNNISSFIGGPKQGGTTFLASDLYDRVEAKFVNIGHDFTSHVRLAVEFDQFTTHYTDGATNFDNRYMLASFFRF